MAKKNIQVDLDLNKNELQNAVIQNLAAAPASPVAGLIWYNITDHLIYFYDGTSSTLGGVIVGSNISVAGDGTISVASATNGVAGIIRIATDAEASTGTAEGIAVNPKQLSAAIAGTQVGALVYKGTWDITSATDFSGITLPVKQGWMYLVTGTGSKTIGGIEWNAGDYIVMNADVAAGGTITNVGKIDNTESSDIVRLNTTQTLTNKTIDADNNTIQDLTTSNFKSGTIVTSVGQTGVDTSLPTEKAVRTAITSALADQPIVRYFVNTALTASGGVCTWTISHSTQEGIVASIREASTQNEVLCDITYNDGSTVVKINSSSNISAGTYVAYMVLMPTAAM